MKRDRHSKADAAPPDAAAVSTEAARLGRTLAPAQAEAISIYLGLLAEWGKLMNLVGPGDWRHWLENLVADSWHLADFLVRSQELGLVAASPRCLDLGAGAGLPGIPLRVFWPAGEYAMVEVREKRTVFLRVALSRIGLPRTSVLGMRVEDLPASALPADLIVSRAFMPWPDLLPLAAGLLAPEGAVLVMANEPAPPEAERASGMRIALQQGYPAPGGFRYFWLFVPESISK